MSQSTMLENAHLRLAFEKEGDQVTGFTLAVHSDGQWHQMGALRPLSHLIYRDKADQRQEMALSARIVSADGRQVRLQGSQTDPDGITWQFAATFSLVEEMHMTSGQIAMYYRLEADASSQVLRWLGPGLYAGEGSFGAVKDEALFPGLEYLMDDDPSSDTRFAADKYANRTVPHPYKITVPLMAVSHGGRSAGIMWAPNQEWHSAWRHPAAVFSSPNRLEPGANNHWLALSAPAVEPRWRNEGELEAHHPCDISPDKPWTLAARLVACPTGGVASILRAWVETYGLPPLPDAGHDYQANVELCVRSFLDVAWDEAAVGWHHTLSDPWGARYEPNLANLLWRYGRWVEGDPALRARARDQVRRGVEFARAKNGADAVKRPHPAPHLDLALTYGQVADALDATAVAARQAMAEQQADGSWPWKPDSVQDVADFKTPERLALMGKEGDSATGFTARQARPVLQYALCVGDGEAAAAARRAADWCNAQRRPEGAQAWELHLHVPDVLAVPYLINLDVGVYQLTGDASYLEEANRWAWTGLPFTYLWNAYYRPIMRYGTIPVFGVTFHDVQPWFGVIVHWNGLVYAESLFRLARYVPRDGVLDWRRLAEGIARHGMQEQMRDGPFQGMYPDAFSPVRGDEEYTWWLNPQLVGLVTFPLAGLPVINDPLILRDGQGHAAHITSGATILEAVWNTADPVRLLLDDQSGETSLTVIASPARPTAIRWEGTSLAEVADVDAVPYGWQWLEPHKVAIVKVQHRQGAVALECTLE